MKNCESCPYKAHRKVPAWGDPKSTIYIVGEAPGADEEQQGIPFVGKAGQWLDMSLRRAGISRSHCYITNVLKCRPPQNKITTPEARRAIECCLPNLVEELEHGSPNVIVPVGNTSLHALVSSDFGISRARGAIFATKYGKTIPTFHPAYLMRQWQEWYTVDHDWEKIARHRWDKRIPTYNEYFNLFPSINDVETFAMEVASRVESGVQVELAIDLETYSADDYWSTPIKVIGFSIDSEHAIVVPFITESGNFAWGTKDEELRAIMAVGSILEDPRTLKIFHNATFDIPVLLSHGYTVDGPIFDTLIAHHMIYEPVDHNLGYVVSIYTDYSAWKLEKQVGNAGLREYNARDCIVLHLIKPHLVQDLIDNEMMPAFEGTMGNVLPVCRMMADGIWIDEEARQRAKTRLTEDTAAALARMREIAGDSDFNPRSTTQLAELLFKKMKFKSAVHTDSGALSVADDVITKLIVRYPDNEFLPLLQKYKHMAQQLSAYIDPPIQSDGRVHARYSFSSAPTGRVITKEPNLQGLPTEENDPQQYIRGMYAAPVGRILLAFDLSQAELRVIAVLARDPVLQKVFLEGGDIHRQNTIDIFGEYKPVLRLFAKRFAYALNYGSSGQELMKTAPKEVLERGGIEDLIKRYFEVHPWLLEYRKTIEREVRDKRKVRNPWGRTRWYVGSTISEADLRSAYNHPIQSTVAEIMHRKQKRVDDLLDRREDRLVLLWHDALYVETQEAKARDLARRIGEIMAEDTEAPNGMVFHIPSDYKIGPNLAEMKGDHD